jgi:hypothetical protein
MSGKRDNNYWSKRLENKNPAVFARWKSGEIPSMIQARLQAGLMRPPSSLIALRREWRKASAADKLAFIALEVPAAAPPPSMTTAPIAPSPPAPPSPPITDADGLLTPATVARIRAHMATFDLKPGQVTRAMGLSHLDPHLTMALKREWRPSVNFAAGVERFFALFAA